MTTQEYTDFLKTKYNVKCHKRYYVFAEETDEQRKDVIYGLLPTRYAVFVRVGFDFVRISEWYNNGKDAILYKLYLQNRWKGEKQ